MTTHYLATLFTPAVKAAQTLNGSRAAYSRHDSSDGMPDALGQQERAFIAARDSFYMATTGETGWPYLQHRGGALGFVKTVSGTQLCVADFRGNRQYVSLGNLASDNRASLFFMDYVNRARLKVLARVTPFALDERPDLAAMLDDAYKAKIERGLLIDVEAFDWNCPQHITPRYSMAEIAPAIDTLKARIAELEKELAAPGR